MTQYVTATLIENATDPHPPIEMDLTTVKPNAILRIATLAIHMTPDRLREVAALITKTIGPAESSKAA